MNLPCGFVRSCKELKMQKAVSSSVSQFSRNHPFERSKRQIYWEGTGAHQLKYEELQESLNAFSAVPEGDDQMRLFNGMVGCYYAFYNDGDNALGAIENNRVHGFRTVRDFAQFCSEQGAVRAERYVRQSTIPWSSAEHDAILLETAMDEVVKMVYK